MIPAMSVSLNSTNREVWKGVGMGDVRCLSVEGSRCQKMVCSDICYSDLCYLPFPQSPTYGMSAMKRARLTARATACWLAAWQPVLRRLTMRPWRLVSLLRQVEVFVVDVHRPRRAALDENRIALGDLLDVLVAVFAGTVVSFSVVRRHNKRPNAARLLLEKTEPSILTEFPLAAKGRLRTPPFK